jgi:hypothetical protein
MDRSLTVMIRDPDEEEYLVEHERRKRARLTYPTELVKAATNASCVIQDALEGNSMPTQEDLSDLCAALALYDPPAEPGKEG